MVDITQLINGFDSQIFSAKSQKPAESFLNYLYTEIQKKHGEMACAICQDKISNFKDLCKPKCSCQLWFHKVCLTQAYKDSKQSGQCLQCRKSVSLLNWETSLKKYWITSYGWRQLYHKLYTKLYKSNLYKEQLWLTQICFGEVTVYREKYPNYILLPVFDFYNYLKFDLEEYSQLLYTNLNDNLEKGGQETPNRIIANPPLYRDGEQVILSEGIFTNRLLEFSYDLIDSDFKWDNVFLAGGSLFRLLSPRFSNRIPDASDLDLFIYGTDDVKRQTALNRILEYFQKKYKDDVFYIVHPKRGLIDLYVRGIARHIQIICNEAKTIVEVLERFDFDHVQLCYFNNKLYATPYTLTTLKTQISPQSKPGSKLKKNRIIKGLSFHLSLIFNSYEDVQEEIENPLKEIKTELKDLKFQEITPNNIKEYLDSVKKLPDKFYDFHANKNQSANTINVSANGIDSDKTYHPSFEESDQEIIKTLRKIVTGNELVVTKDIKLVIQKITFVKRDDGNFYY